MIKTPLRYLLCAGLLLACFAFTSEIFAQRSGVTLKYTYPFADGELEEGLGENPVVVELFSSQACSFCPMADHFVADLKKRTNLIILACHVDYFDVRSGAISTPECSRRQRNYAQSLRGATLYTPQVIINGHSDYVGYEFDRFMDLAIEESQKPIVQPLLVKPVAEDIPGSGPRFELDLVPFKLGGGAEATNLDIFLYMLDPDRVINVSEGANKGQDLPYINIVSETQRIGNWDGTPQKVGFTIDAFENYQGAVVLLKTKRGKIVAAHQINKD
jgi:hypothetical protein